MKKTAHSIISFERSYPWLFQLIVGFGCLFFCLLGLALLPTTPPEQHLEVAILEAVFGLPAIGFGFWFFRNRRLESRTPDQRPGLTFELNRVTFRNGETTVVEIFEYDIAQIEPVRIQVTTNKGLATQSGPTFFYVLKVTFRSKDGRVFEFHNDDYPTNALANFLFENGNRFKLEFFPENLAQHWLKQNNRN